MKGLNGKCTDCALRVMVPTIGLFVLIAHASQGVAKVTAHHFTWHSISSGMALASVWYIHDSTPPLRLSPHEADCSAIARLMTYMLAQW